ncbi:lysylphosphatidylglycerol synthase transmembrane domain-containing protein [Baaleninema sp.]|uniref:lysylphosphatidylglycerol synthase transmembrane domain-containing protein n=1 Tax=Baaleninema sp. TaxID=3101197 RepID=UPI003D00B365
MLKSLFARLKPYLKTYLRWVVLGATLFFLAQTLKSNWQEVAEIRLRDRGGSFLVLAFGVTMLAHTWSGWVWGWILRECDQSVSMLWATRVFLKTNVAKYLPGNIWHFYGRIREATQIGLSVMAATASVVLEALLMAASALPMVALALPGHRADLSVVALAAVLVGIHPRWLNPVLERLERVKLKGKLSDNPLFRMRRYPLRPLLGEVAFVGLRGLGFLLAWAAITPWEIDRLSLVFGGFSLAWLLGLVIPGAPGGIGVFEATAVAVLDGEFPAVTVLAAVALYRLISVAAEALGAGLAVALEGLRDRRRSD